MTSGRGFLVVRVEGRRFGLPLETIRETLDAAPVYPVPAVLRALLGVTTARGRILSVVHLGALFGHPPPAAPRTATVVLAHASRGWIALAVDDVERVGRGTWYPVPAGQEWPWALGVIPDDAGVIPIVDVIRVTERLGQQEGAAA